LQVLDRAAWQCRNGWSGAPFTLGAVIEKSDTEVFDALVVLEPEHGSRVLAQRSAAPVAQTAAVAAGGLVAGAVLARLFGRHRQRFRVGRGGRRIGARKRPESGLLQIVASRSLLVDVHLLDASGRRR